MAEYSFGSISMLYYLIYKVLLHKKWTITVDFSKKIYMTINVNWSWLSTLLAAFRCYII